MCVGKPSGGAVVQIASQDLSWAMQDWELSEEPTGDVTQPHYCRNTFDAITMGKTTKGCQNITLILKQWDQKIPEEISRWAYRISTCTG